MKENSPFFASLEISDKRVRHIEGYSEFLQHLTHAGDKDIGDRRLAREQLSIPALRKRRFPGASTVSKRGNRLTAQSHTDADEDEDDS